MKITKNNDTVILLSKAKQSHNCLLNNNSKFYIFQFILFYKRIHAKSGQTPNSCSFFVEKKNQKTTTFFVKKVDKKTTPFRIRNSLVKTFSLIRKVRHCEWNEAIYLVWIATLYY